MVQGLGFGVQGPGYRVQGSGFMVYGSGFWSLRCVVRDWTNLDSFHVVDLATGRVLHAQRLLRSVVPIYPWHLAGCRGQGSRFRV